MATRLNLAKNEFRGFSEFMKSGPWEVNISNDDDFETSDTFRTSDGSIELKLTFRKLNHDAKSGPALDLSYRTTEDEDWSDWTNVDWKLIHTHYVIADDDGIYFTYEIYEDGDCVLSDSTPELIIHVHKVIRTTEISPGDLYTDHQEHEFYLSPGSTALLIQCAQTLIRRFIVKMHRDSSNKVASVLSLLQDHKSFEGDEIMDIVYGLNFIEKYVPIDMLSLVIKLMDTMGDAKSVTVEVFPTTSSQIAHKRYGGRRNHVDK